MYSKHLSATKKLNPVQKHVPTEPLKAHGKINKQTFRFFNESNNMIQAL